MKKRLFIIVLACLILFLLACRLSPGVAQFALDGLSRPGVALLHRMTAPVPFPLAEPLALALAAVLTCTLLSSLASAQRLRRWLRGAAWTALALGGLLALLWAPALCVPEEAVPAPTVDQLAWLCDDLVGQLNASPLAFPEPVDALRLAPAVSGGPARAVKAARYPEWMAASRIWGLFVPLTGEAVVSTDAPAPLIPFTAVHELMHLSGIAGEGAANVAAWEKCLLAGGPFADSARLWALRYAMGQLRESDPAAWRETTAKMEGPLKQTFLDCGGEADPAGHSSAPLSLSRGDYAALVGYLAKGDVAD